MSGSLWHGLPPNEGGMQALTRTLLPNPQEELQADHIPHSSHLPSIAGNVSMRLNLKATCLPGQWSTSQVLLSVGSPWQALPPNLEEEQGLTLAWKPLPQEWLQDDHAPHFCHGPCLSDQGKCQSIVIHFKPGNQQWEILQAALSWEFPGHWLPPKEGGLHALTLTLAPSPQEWLQGDHSPHFCHVPSTAGFDWSFV